MELAQEWKDYEILDMADGQKLERWGKQVLIRPDPQIIWKEKTYPELWKKANATYLRSNTGGGNWEYHLSILFIRDIFGYFKTASGEKRLSATNTECIEQFREAAKTSHYADRKS